MIVGGFPLQTATTTRCLRDIGAALLSELRIVVTRAPIKHRGKQATLKTNNGDVPDAPGLPPVPKPGRQCAPPVLSVLIFACKEPCNPPAASHARAADN